MASPTATGDADLAALGAVLAEPARARMLLALGDGRALAASVLASEAGVAPSTASGHLSRLVDAGLLSVLPQGRHRYYRLAGPQVGELLEVLSRVAPAAPVRSLRQGTQAEALRSARTCYDHLAGRLGVAVFAALLDAGHVVGGDGTHDPLAAHEDRLSAPGHDLDYRLTSSAAGRRRAPPLRRAALLRRLERAAPPPLGRDRPRSRIAPARLALDPARRQGPRRVRHRPRPARAAADAGRQSRIAGKSTTSRIVSRPVSSMTRRSMPMPMPPVGGMPCSSART